MVKSPSFYLDRTRRRGKSRLPGMQPGDNQALGSGAKKGYTDSGFVFINARRLTAGRTPGHGDFTLETARFDDDRLLASEPRTFGGPTIGSEERFQVEFLVNDPRGVICYEAFAAGSTVNWAFWHDEVHVITGGTAQVTYTLPPNHRRTVTKRFTAGDAYLIPNGTRARFAVTEDGPYLHVCVIMPRFEYTKDERADTYE